MKKILLVGDSIRMGYDKYIKKIFEDTAEVYYPDENCRFSTYVLRNLASWRDQLDCGDDIDLIHWNAGLWDDLRMLDGEPLVGLEEYSRNVERIYSAIGKLFPKARIIFATSTPVREELFTTLKRYNADTERYNAEAVRISLEHGAIINDLYGIVKGAPKSYYSDMTHLYTKEGTELVTEQVRRSIESVLSIEGKDLDYEALFSDKKSVLGI
ncbi:MAG: SGNH/GDSL hydrolase family protein [Clostridia bacterium]|nr:SGNH/GDSL hydrolase family protein [Clostridia bacterium]